MELLINQFGHTGDPSSALIVHNGESIKWNVKAFDRASTPVDGSFDVFEHINGYWKYQKPEVQDKIFDVYKRIKQVFYESTLTTSDLTQSLYPLISELYMYHDLSDIKRWIDFHGNVRLPAEIEFHNTFEEAQKKSITAVREKTYLKQDYYWLRALSVSLRSIYPVWGEFIDSTKLENGNTWKEYYAFRLLSYTNLAKSETMGFLRAYVESTLIPGETKPSAILGGLSSDEYPTWILGLIMVRRLVVGDIRGIEPKSSLVTSIFSYIRQRDKTHESNFIGNIKEKISEGKNQEGENNLSGLEGYKIKQEIPAGDIAIINHYINDVTGIALRICPDIDLALLHISLQSVMALETEQILEAQETIIQWVLAPAVSPRGIPYLTKLGILKAMAITQALLWHRGHYEIACLLSAKAQQNTDEIQSSGVETRSRITKDLAEQLDALFPYVKRPPGKQRVTGKDVKEKTIKNPAAIAIEIMAKLFSSNEWRLTIPSEWVAQITGNKNNRSYSVPFDIRIKLANLAIAVAKKTF